MLFKVASRNSETIQITHFAAQNGPKDPDPDAIVLQSMDVLIPADAGPYAAAAMLLGFRDRFLSKVTKKFDKDQQEMFDQAELVLSGLEASLAPVEQGKIIKP